MTHDKDPVLAEVPEGWIFDHLAHSMTGGFVCTLSTYRIEASNAWVTGEGSTPIAAVRNAAQKCRGEM